MDFVHSTLPETVFVLPGAATQAATAQIVKQLVQIVDKEADSELIVAFNALSKNLTQLLFICRFNDVLVGSRPAIESPYQRLLLEECLVAA